MPSSRFSRGTKGTVISRYATSQGWKPIHGMPGTTLKSLTARSFNSMAVPGAALLELDGVRVGPRPDQQLMSVLFVTVSDDEVVRFLPRPGSDRPGRQPVGLRPRFDRLDLRHPTAGRAHALLRHQVRDLAGVRDGEVRRYLNRLAPPRRMIAEPGEAPHCQECDGHYDDRQGNDLLLEALHGDHLLDGGELLRLPAPEPFARHRGQALDIACRQVEPLALQGITGRAHATLHVAGHVPPLRFPDARIQSLLVLTAPSQQPLIGREQPHKSEQRGRGEGDNEDHRVPRQRQQRPKNRVRRRKDHLMEARQQTHGISPPPTR